MDIEKLIDRLGENTDCWTDKVHGYADLRLDAATALSTLQAENERLRSDLRRFQTERDTLLAANQHLMAEREQLTAERDAAQALLAERSGVTGSAPITTAFGVPLDRLRELVKADRDGRCVVLPCKIGDTLYRIQRFKRGKNWRKEAEFIRTVELNRNNFWRIVMDEEIGKTVFLTREDAEAALRREQE